MDAALAAYEEGLEIARDLVARDPGNLQFAVDVAISNAKLGQLAPATGDRGAACSRFAEANAAFLAAVEIDPTHRENQRMAALSQRDRVAACTAP